MLDIEKPNMKMILVKKNIKLFYLKDQDKM